MRSFGLVAVLIGGFSLACLLLDRLLPVREMPSLVQQKVAHLAAHPGEYNALLIGSSRVQDHIIPAVFDRDVAAQGVAIKSFNAGISGMYPPQDAYLLDRILKLKLTGIRWVFIELQTLQTTLPRHNRETMEQVYWHDWPRFSLLCERLITTRPHRHWRDHVTEVWERVPDFWDHTRFFIQCLTNLGRGSTLLNRWVTGEKVSSEEWSLLGESRDGWVPAGVGHVMDARETAALEGDMEARRKKPSVKESSDHITQKALDLMIAKIQRAGATPVLFIPPTSRGTYFYPDPDRVRGLIVLDFCRPLEYPELYQTKYRVDPSHLNAAGAEILSHLFAARFVEAVRQR